jgi:flagellar protein FliS
MKLKGNAQAYLRDRVLTASPEELRLLLLEGSIRFARQGLSGIEEKDYEKSYLGVSQCQDILLELINALRPEVAPELCKNLAALYTYLYRQTIDALREKNADIMREVLGLLEYERESWLLVMEQLRRERGGTASPGGHPVGSSVTKGGRRETTFGPGSSHGDGQSTISLSG